MGEVYLKRPQFLAGRNDDIKFNKLMFIRKGGKAIHQLGDLSRDYYNVELICISDEDEENWIGNYAEGYGFFNVRFAKKDCREATDEEVDMWINNPNSITF